MVEISFLAAFLGGVLSLLSPCSALLLPAFFAYAFTSRTQLLGRTLLFLAGLATVLVPLGMGASVVATLLLDYREATIVAAGILVIGFGLLQLAGGGFRFLPERLAARVQLGQSAGAVYATGLVYALAGFCSGPLLGAVLTVAGASAEPLRGAGLLFTYAFGTAAPLFAIAWLWDRWALGQRAWLHGRLLVVGPLRVHTTNLAAGTLLILFGVSFIISQGSSALSAVYADLGLEDLSFRAQAWIVEHLDRVPDLLLVMAIVGIAGGLGLGQTLRRGKARAASTLPSPRVEPGQD